MTVDASRYPARRRVRWYWRLQRAVLWASWVLHAGSGRRDRPRRVVVGLADHAGYLTATAAVAGDPVTVKVNVQKFFDHSYTHDLSRFPTELAGLASAWLLGRLVRRTHTLVYISGEGFLRHEVDGRAHEFEFLERHGVRIVCVFTGSDIRSHELTQELGRAWGRDMVTTYQAISNPGIDHPSRDAVRWRLAAAADRHAAVIVNPSVDQITYLERETEPFPYLYPDDKIARRPDKWREGGQLRVLHAPSSPMIKATPLVRAAVSALRADGLDFDYVELIGVTHDRVLKELAHAHVVLNQFYALMPGVFGVEALAANAVLLCSADEHLEPSLPAGSNDAWVVTTAWQVEGALRRTLTSSRADLQAQADRGTDWLASHGSAAAGREQVRGWLGGAASHPGNDLFVAGSARRRNTMESL